jgi:hypothetical protein
MSAQDIERVLREVEDLTPDEQRTLIDRLMTRLRAREQNGGKRPRWEDYEGTAPYPLCGEDAQQYISRTRQESDDRRRIP